MHIVISTVTLIIFLFMSVAYAITPAPAQTPPVPAPTLIKTSPLAQPINTSILILGDSLTEGLGVNAEHAYPSVLEKKLNDQGYGVKIINGGVSGATSASGLNRLKWHLKKHIDMIVLQLGANDGLRGFNIPETQKNLAQIIQLAQQRQIKILLLGLRMPPNYGQQYTDDFKNMYVQLGKTYQIPTLPAFLTGVEGMATLNQADGIHPNIQGHEVIANNVHAFIVKHLHAPNKNGSITQ